MKYRFNLTILFPNSSSAYPSKDESVLADYVTYDVPGVLVFTNDEEEEVVAIYPSQYTIIKSIDKF